MASSSLKMCMYYPFFEYRKRLIDIVRKAKMGESINQEDLSRLVEVSTNGIGDMKSLGGAMKDDLGSYMRVVIQCQFGNYLRVTEGYLRMAESPL